MKISGFTLIELLITVALIAFLAMIALPMTAAWIDGPDVTRGETLVRQALSKAKNIAIREGNADAPAAPTSAICINTTQNGVLVVSVLSQDGNFGNPVPRNPPACDARGNAPPGEDAPGMIHQATLPRGVAISDANNNEYNCTCFNGSGQITNGLANCNLCTDNNDNNQTLVTISKGNENAQIAIY